MATIKLVYQTHKKTADGNAPIYLRITENRMSSNIATGVKIPEKDWNKDRQEVRKTHPEYVVLNDELTRQKAKATSTSIKVRQRARGRQSAAAVKQELIGKGGGSVLAYAENYSAHRAATNHYSDARNILVVIKKLRAFIKRDDLAFEEIDRAFLRRFNEHLLKKYNNNQNTRAKNLQMLRRVIRQAIDDGLLAAADDPFLNFRLPTTSVSKERLSIEKIRALESLELSSEPQLAVVRDAFLASFYMAGIRFGDLCALKWENVPEGRLVYTMMKTGTKMDLKICPQALEILKRYTPDSPVRKAFVFPLLDSGRDFSDSNFLRRGISSKNVVVNRHLKTLAERIDTPINLTFHIARHSFADYARIHGKDLYALMNVMGHSKLVTTQAYLAAFDREAEDGLMKGLFG